MRSAAPIIIPNSGFASPAHSASSATKSSRPPRCLRPIYVYESQVAEVATAKIDGLRRFYGVEDDAGVEFFTTHREADPYHADAIAGLIERHYSNHDDRAVAIDAARAALRAVWDLLDCV